MYLLTTVFNFKGFKNYVNSSDYFFLWITFAVSFLRIFFAASKKTAFKNYAGKKTKKHLCFFDKTKADILNSWARIQLAECEPKKRILKNE